MLLNELLKRLLKHTSSLTLVVLIGVLYLLGNHSWLDAYLPINGKPLVISLAVSLIFVYELIGSRVNLIDTKIKEVLCQMEVNRLIQAVNGLYGRFIASGDTVIDNEYTIKELLELVDMRTKLDINSYTQGRLEFLVSKIKRD